VAVVQLCAGLIVRQEGARLHNAGMGPTYIQVLHQGVCQWGICSCTRAVRAISPPGIQQDWVSGGVRRLQQSGFLHTTSVCCAGPVVWVSGAPRLGLYV
jgi:hypothetical protein